MSILVITEHRNGELKKNAFETVSYASQMAKQNSKNVVAVAFGNVADEELTKLSEYGAHKAVVISDDKYQYEDSWAYTKIIAEIFEKENANTVVFSHSNFGKSLAPRLSAKLKAGVASGVVDLPHNYEPFEVKRKTYNGAAFLNVKVNTDSKIITVNANACEVIEDKTDNFSVEQYKPQADADIKTKVTDVDVVTGKVILTEADVVVAGGRGMKSGDNWQPLEELADLLGAGLACSRPVSDEHWRPHDEHVGQTGKIIAPSLYIAVGISGAIQHIGGVSASKVIVAIDKDKEAPIFSYADYGIVGDAFKVLPNFIDSVKKLKAK